VLFLSHTSAEKGAGALMRALQEEGGEGAAPPTAAPPGEDGGLLQHPPPCAILPPVLDMQLRLGEGTGAVMLLPLLRSACSILGMGTLAEALGGA